MIEIGQQYSDNDIRSDTEAGKRVVEVVEVATPRGPDYARCVVVSGKRPGSYTWIRVDRLGTESKRGYTLITDKENAQ